MNGRAIQGAYLFRLYVCDKEMSWPHHIQETHQSDWVVYVRDSEKFRLTNVIPERIIFVSRGITVVILSKAYIMNRSYHYCFCHTSLTLRSRVLLETLTVFHQLFVTIKFITLNTSSSFWSISLVKWIRPTSSKPTIYYSFLI